VGWDAKSVQEPVRDRGVQALWTTTTQWRQQVQHWRI
jgi:hypothetical protein